MPSQAISELPSPTKRNGLRLKFSTFHAYRFSKVLACLRIAKPIPISKTNSQAVYQKINIIRAICEYSGVYTNNPEDSKRKEHPKPII
jgi:hypothetical protein